MDEETIAELRRMGVSEKKLTKARAKNREQKIEVEPENWNAVRVFIALQTQWHYQPRSNGKVSLLSRTGLDYTAVPVVCSAHALDLDEELLTQIRALESESLAIYAERDRKMLA